MLSWCTSNPTAGSCHCLNQTPITSFYPVPGSLPSAPNLTEIIRVLETSVSTTQLTLFGVIRLIQHNDGAPKTSYPCRAES